MDDTLVLIPAYQPTENLIELANSLYTVGFRIVIVDDGSGSKYSAVFDRAEAYATVIGYEENRGKGYALKYGIDFAVKEKSYFKYLITVDSDGQHSEEAVRRVSELLHKKGGVVLGERDSKKSRQTKLERFANFCMRTYFSLATGIYVPDIMSGLRGFEFSYLEHLTLLSGEGFDFETNVLFDAAKRRVPIRTVKIEEADWQTPKTEQSHYYLESFIEQLVMCIGKSYPSLLSMLADYALIWAVTALVGSSLPGLVGGVLLGSYVGVALSVILNNKIGYEENSDGILSYNRIIMGMLRMFAYMVFMVILHSAIGLTVALSLLITVIVTAIIEVRVMKNGFDRDLRVRPEL